MISNYTVLGMMSGSSLDGVDLALCEFLKRDSKPWTYQILYSETIPFSSNWQVKLAELPSKKATEIIEADIEFGKLLGRIAAEFLHKNKLKPDFISSHGHTLFHEPDKGFTFQLGNGQGLATQSGFPVICDFRTKDILLGGQGAPLVPIGDQKLFDSYEMCLNLGGIANISFHSNNKRIAYDICPANQVLNHLSNKMGLAFDKNGEIAKSGTLNKLLLDQLNQDRYYSMLSPKSLSNQYVKHNFIDLVERLEDSTENKFRTIVEHIAIRISTEINGLPKGRMLATGGGANNSFLMDRLKALSKHDIIIPEKKLVDFKEALVFAFMGVLRHRNETNCMASVTGAKSDCSSGVIYYP